MEGIVPEYDGAGVVREPSGTTVTGIVPTNTYRCDDGKYVVIGGNGDSIFKRLMTAAGRSDMAENPAMANNAGRIVHEDAIDEALGLWCASHASTHIINTLEAVQVPVGPIYSVQDMMVDPQYQARGLFENVEIDGRPLKIPAIMPKLDATPGRTDWPGMAIGSHNDEILRGILKLDDARIERLRADGVIG
jgi:crotonobetainyl-CoA:carnitine CoA-transferase CaiB-like acyl-CoA transferase